MSDNPNAKPPTLIEAARSLIDEQRSGDLSLSGVCSLGDAVAALPPDAVVVSAKLLVEASLMLDHRLSCISHDYEWDGSEPLVIPCSCSHDSLKGRLRAAAEGRA